MIPADLHTEGPARLCVGNRNGVGGRKVAEEIQRQNLSLIGCGGAEGKDKGPALGLRRWMAGGVPPTTMRHLREEQGGNTLSSSSASEGGVGRLHG